MSEKGGPEKWGRVIQRQCQEKQQNRFGGRGYEGKKKQAREERPQKNANDVWLRNDEAFFVRDELPFLIPFTRNKTALFS